MKDVVGMVMMLVVILLIAGFFITSLSTINENTVETGTINTSSNAGLNFVGQQTSLFSTGTFAIVLISVAVFIIGVLTMLGRWGKQNV